MMAGKFPTARVVLGRRPSWLTSCAVYTSLVTHRTKTTVCWQFSYQELDIIPIRFCDATDMSVYHLHLLRRLFFFFFLFYFSSSLL